MLLIPLDGSEHDVVGIALAGGARLLGAGPFPASIVVVADRSRIEREVASWNIIIIAAPPAGCGTGAIPKDGM